ncbi:hypothetical protein AY599_25145 [Leptolyngbya valderiana BDU 20041]|nr:hypothetical protein AY599_25145 [Leptolyngbya valderiana BDU 20041]
MPRTEAEFVPWLKDHVAIWQGNQGTPPDIGLSAAQVAAVAGLSTTLEEKYQQLKDLKAQKKAARVEKDTALALARAMVGGDIEIIDGYAKTTGDPDVYARAQIDPPRDRTPRSEAPIPTNLSTDTTTSGDVVFTFKASKAGGAVFEVQRQLVPVGELPGAWQSLGTIGDKEYVDQNVPSGLAQINYRVRTILTTGIVGQWSFPAPFYFGSGNQATLPVQAAQAAAAHTAQSEPVDAAPEGDGQEPLTIEDAQQLKDAQTAKGKGKAG